jgi:hypothetical protein
LKKMLHDYKINMAQEVENKDKQIKAEVEKI